MAAPATGTHYELSDSRDWYIIFVTVFLEIVFIMVIVFGAYYCCKQRHAYNDYSLLVAQERENLRDILRDCRQRGISTRHFSFIPIQDREGNIISCRPNDVGSDSEPETD